MADRSKIQTLSIRAKVPHGRKISTTHMAETYRNKNVRKVGRRVIEEGRWFSGRLNERPGAI